MTELLEADADWSRYRFGNRTIPGIAQYAKQNYNLDRKASRNPNRNPNHYVTARYC